MFLEGADNLGTLDQILEEAGFLKRNHKLECPKFISTQRISLPLHAADAKV